MQKVNTAYQDSDGRDVCADCGSYYCVNPEEAKRLESYERACLLFANPEADIKKIVEALRLAKDLVKHVLYEHPDDEIAQEQNKVIEEALSLYQDKE